MRCPACDAKNPADAVRCGECGESLRRQRRHPDPDEDDGEEDEEEGGLASTIVPYKNLGALVGYYCAYLSPLVGVGAIIVILLIGQKNDWFVKKQLPAFQMILFVGMGVGMLIALVGFILGGMGFVYVRNHPAAKGTGHAVFAMLAGGVNLVWELAAIILVGNYINSIAK